jgi:hypothetical protein
MRKSIKTKFGARVYRTGGGKSLDFFSETERLLKSPNSFFLVSLMIMVSLMTIWPGHATTVVARHLFLVVARLRRG